MVLKTFNATLNVSTNTSAKGKTFDDNSTDIVMWETVLISLYSAVLVIGGLGNSIVIYTFGWKRRHKKLTNEFLLTCLGVCDLLSSIILPVLFLIHIYTYHSMTSYVVGCLVEPPLIVAGVTMSEIILILICYDRYRAITKPLERKLCITFAKIGTLVGFAITLILSIPIFLDLSIDHEKDVCFRISEDSPILIIQTAIMVSRDFTALIIMAWLIRKMLRALSSSERFRRNSNSSVICDFKRTRKLLFTVVSLFTICIFPFDIYMLWATVNYRNKALDRPEWNSLIRKMTSLILLQVLNSTVNVFVYSAINQEFQIVLRGILRGICTQFVRVDRKRGSCRTDRIRYFTENMANSGTLGNTPSLSRPVLDSRVAMTSK